jgi:hypothetical protein
VVGKRLQLVAMALIIVLMLSFLNNILRDYSINQNEPE